MAALRAASPSDATAGRDGGASAASGRARGSPAGRTTLRQARKASSASPAEQCRGPRGRRTRTRAARSASASGRPAPRPCVARAGAAQRRRPRLAAVLAAKRDRRAATRRRPPDHRFRRYDLLPSLRFPASDRHPLVAPVFCMPLRRCTASRVRTGSPCVSSILAARDALTGQLSLSTRRPENANPRARAEPPNARRGPGRMFAVPVSRPTAAALRRAKSWPTRLR